MAWHCSLRTDLHQLDYYLPLPALLDPSLDLIVPPLMAVLSRWIGALVTADQAGESLYVDSKRIGRIGILVNWVVKIRGWKAVGTCSGSEPSS
jgi:hypothetical protein